MASYLCGFNNSSDERLHDQETEVNENTFQERLKRWRFLEKKIIEKQEKVNKGLHSKRLQPYKTETEELKMKLLRDIRKLKLELAKNNVGELDLEEDKNSHASGYIPRRKDNILPRNRETDTLKRKLEESENENDSLKRHHQYEIEGLKEEIRKLTERLTINKSSYEDLKRRFDDLEAENASLQKKHKESEDETLAQKYGPQEEIGVLKGTIRRLEESRTKEREQVQHHDADPVQKEKEECKTLKRKLEESENENDSLKRHHQDEIQGLKEEISKLTEKLKSKHDESENEIVALQLSHKEEIGAHKEEIRKLKERLTMDNSSYEKREKQLKTKCDELEADIASYKENWTKSEDAKIQLTIQITELKNKSEEGEREIKMWTNRLEEDKKKTEGELKSLEAKNNQLNNQLDNERKAKEDALLRLSSMASNKLRNNNPNIADLSDPNRPTKLSEQFSELYDNEWTEAFDELEKLLGGKQEKEIISYLRDFVLEIHYFCNDISSSKLKQIEQAFVEPLIPSEGTKLPTEIFKTIKDGMKSMAPKFLEHTRERVLGHLEEKYLTDPVVGCLQHKYVKQYIDKCTEVCWYMSVQDPQLVMDGSKSPDEKFDSNKHREYTKKGPYEEFIVWPVLYLYKGGQMMCKGVAQGAKKEMIQQQ